MNSPRQRAIAEFVLDHLVWFMLAAVLIAFSIFVPNFFQIGIFANIVEQSTFVGVMAIGLAIVIIAGHMDLSVESTAALAAGLRSLNVATFFGADVRLSGAGLTGTVLGLGLAFAVSAAAMEIDLLGRATQQGRMQQQVHRPIQLQVVAMDHRQGREQLRQGSWWFRIPG